MKTTTATAATARTTFEYVETMSDTWCQFAPRK
jgi:hypothetical protein